MSAFSREVLESISKWSEILGAAFALLAGAAAVMFIIVNKPLRRIEELESLQEKQKTALAQKAAADAQLELRRNIAYGATPRRVTGSRNNDEAIRAPRVTELKKYAGTKALIVFVKDEEAKLLAFDIRAALLNAGWHADIAEMPASIPLGYIQAGVQVRTLENVARPSVGQQVSLTQPAIAKAIVDLLQLDLTEPYGPFTGVTWSPDIISDGEKIGVSRYGLEFPKGGIVITVGAKPVWEFLLTHDIPQPAIPNK
jgi:hypothetical protein